MSIPVRFFRCKHLHPTFNVILFYTFILTLLFGCKKKQSLSLYNSNILRVSDSIKIPLDSLTIPKSKNIHYKDSILLVHNENGNSVSLIGLGGASITHYEISDLFVDSIKPRIDAAWLESPDSIFIYSATSKQIYLFNSNKKIIDSYSVVGSKERVRDITFPQPIISTSQPPIVFNNLLYYTGFSIGENLKIPESARFILGEISKKEVTYYINYPIEYSQNNWGGLLYRMVYNCQVEDSLLYISFPASNHIAEFNIRTKKTKYLKLFPDLTQHIEPFSGNWERKFDFNKKDIAAHFYGQYSYRSIFYDKYRKVFYRFLLLPTNSANMELGKMGIQKKYVLVYDRNFLYLGYTELAETTSSSECFITEKGLYIKNNKHKYDEDNLYYYLLTFRAGDSQ